jgi:hypothetical protein
MLPDTRTHMSASTTLPTSARATDRLPLRLSECVVRRRGGKREPVLFCFSPLSSPLYALRCGRVQPEGEVNWFPQNPPGVGKLWVKAGAVWVVHASGWAQPAERLAMSLSAFFFSTCSSSFDSAAAS